MKIILPYLNETELFKEAKKKLEETTPKEVELICVHDKEKKGFSAMVNEYFGTDDIILWHTDLIPTENWYNELMKYYDKADIIGCKLVYPDGLIQHYGGFIRGDGVGDHPDAGFKDIGYNKPRECLFITFAGCLIKKEVKIKIDENYLSGYFGDVDHCFQARKQGFKLLVVPVKLIHHESVDNAKANPNQLKDMKNNVARFQAKWMSELSKGLYK